jgi:hypothetical protein
VVGARRAHRLGDERRRLVERSLEEGARDQHRADLLGARLVRELEHDAGREVDRVREERVALRLREERRRRLVGEALRLVRVGAGAAAVVGGRRVLRALVAEAERAGHVLEALEPGLDRVLARHGLREERLVRQAVVVVGVRDLAVADAPHGAELGREDLVLRRLAHVLERLLARIGLLGRVAEDELRVVAHLPVEVAHARRLEQPRDEGEVALVVLHAVLARLLRALTLDDRVEAPLGEHRLHDVEVRHLLEDAAVGALREHPEARDHDDVVDGDARLLVRDLLDLGDDALEEARRRRAGELRGEEDLDRRVAPDDRLEVDDGVLAGGDDVDLEQLRDAVVDRELADVELIVAVDVERETGFPVELHVATSTATGSTRRAFPFVSHFARVAGKKPQGVDHARCTSDAPPPPP